MEKIFETAFLKKKIIPRWKLNSLFAGVLLIGAFAGSFFTTTNILIPFLFAAGDTSATWDLSSDETYTLGDSTKMEVLSDTSAQLSVQKYTSDGNTALLLHLDESSGTTAVDSSSNSNDATTSQASWETGNLDNAFHFNGTSDSITVADEAANSFSQAHSIEAWTKLDSSFSAGSHLTNQPIVDKGDYRLYYDNQTGKIVYEVMSSSSGTWTQQGGAEINDSWSFGVHDSVKSVTGTSSNNVYAGLGYQANDAEVWHWDGSSWTMIGGDSLNSSWGVGYDEVQTMVMDGTTLYVGLGDSANEAEVWKWETSTWTKIGDNDTIAVNLDRINSMVMYDDGGGEDLYIGTGISTDEGRVFRWNGSTWDQVAGRYADAGYTSWDDAANIDYVHSLVADGSYLYAGLGATVNDGQVWRFDGSAGADGEWTQIGGNGSSGWGSSDAIESVYSLSQDTNYLYAGLGVSTDDAEVWRYDKTGGTWTQIAGNGAAGAYTAWDGANNLEAVYSLTGDTSYLYAGLGNGNDDGEVWRFDKSGETWSQIGGDDLNSGWVNGNNTRRVEALTIIDSTLYSGIYNASDNGELWTWSGSAWSQLGGSHINGSWGTYGIDRVQSMTVSGDNLYAGLGASAGDAQVWEFDGSNWQIIGGQAVNGSWTADTYDYVYSLTGTAGDVYAGLGLTADEGEVWRYRSGSWTQIGGEGADSGYASWGDADNIEYVFSLTEDATYVYAGTGTSTDDGEVWRFHKTNEVWDQIGGAGASASYSSWDASSNIEDVLSLSTDGSNLYAGLGRSASDAEVWKWDGSTWTKIGGDGINSGWATGYDSVYSLAFYQGELYAGLGISTAEAEVWKWNGTSWSQIGGDGLLSGWVDSSYERVNSLAVYSGKLYAGLGTSAGDGEVWEYNGSTWTQIGGDSLNSGFDATIEETNSMAAYNGSLYAGLGNSANADAEVWSYGTSRLLKSTTNSFDTSWRHIAATYDGGTMKLYIDGTLNNSTTVAQFVNDSDNDILIGAGFGSETTGSPQAQFDGLIDEVRLSDSARSSFTTKPYTSTAQTINPSTALMKTGIKNWEDFLVTDSADGGTLTYRLSNDGGSTWKYWDGDSWEVSASTAQANSESDLNTNIDSFPIVYNQGILWQAILSGDGTQLVAFSDVQITATSDTTDPSNPSLLTALSQQSGGSAIGTGSTNAYPNPYFSWSGATDTGGVGVYGYYVYFGTDTDADPLTAGTLQTAATYEADSLTNGETYYLKIKTVDTAQNIANSSWPTTPFEYTYATTSPKPSNVDYILPASGTFGNVTDMNFSWPTSGSAAAAPYDGGPDIVGWQYAINNTDTWLGTYTDAGLGMDYIPVGYSQPYYLTQDQDAPYLEIGDNTIYFRAVDSDGNVADEIAGILAYGGAAPTFATNCNIPSGITVTPSTNTANSFALTWNDATPDSGNFVEHYYYMINTSPPSTYSTVTSNTATYIDNDTDTAVSATSLPGVVKGSNTVYVVAIDNEDNYAASNCIKGAFTLNSTFPDPPKNLSVSDASVKSSSLWRASIAWDVPDYTGTGQLTYQIQRSTDGTNWTTITTTTGTAYVDTVSESTTYYWRVGTYDTSSESISAPSYANAVTLLPKGSYTEAASLSDDPEVTGVTTKKATISWVTSRSSDSKISYGTSSGNYFDEEPSNSTQTTAHSIGLTNLEPGTTYHYVAKWTDEDGNTGTSEESTFTTDPAPTVTDPRVTAIGLESATITFTSTGATTAKVYYGETTSFGGFTELSTATSESEYSINLSGLEDGTKYYYKINTFDSEDAEYEGSSLTFETLPRPKISGVRVQQVKGTAQPTILVSWNTNTEVSSIVTYFPQGSPAGARDEVNVALTEGEHQMVVRGLLPNTPYTIVVKGRDKLGNEAQSDPQQVTTATDTRPPKISNLKVEGSIQQNTGDNSVTTAQLVISWDTDEPATSQVDFGEGTGATYSQKSQEDSNLTFNHVVIVSGLSPSKVYHLRAISVDDGGNEGLSVDTVTITPKANRSALDLVISNLSEAFGFLKGI